MYNAIILSSCLLGSFYTFSRSLDFLNRTDLENKKISNELLLINGITLGLSGSIIIYYGVYLLSNAKIDSCL